MSGLTHPNVSVFSYGSNLCLGRIRARVPGARPVAMGFVTERRFIYHKLSRDGSGKADARFTGSHLDRIWGVVYEIPYCQKPDLDHCESLGRGYDEAEVEVTVDGGRRLAWMYVAREQAIRPRLQPYSWYHDYIIHGGEEQGLPRDYLDELRKFSADQDPDPERHARNAAIVRSCSQRSISNSRQAGLSSARLAAGNQLDRRVV